jgi:anhydro-N-acetylmuramic acid kinase
MISGTSFDAVEAVLAELDLEDDVLACHLVEHRSVPYPAAVREAIAAILPPAGTTIEQVCQLDVAIGQFFATVARGLVDSHGGVEAVCSHGQTVYHWVEGGGAKGTLQLGEPAWVAEATGAVVVSDVRNRDIAAGGHGAPLASLLDVLLLGREPAVVSGSLNLGGIANATIVARGREPIAFDIGPANALLDATVEWLTDGQEHYDRDGARAGRGRADERLVDRLMNDPYFSLPPPKSTGKEYFNLGYVTSRLGRGRLDPGRPDPGRPDGKSVGPDDLLASITVATAEVVATALRNFDVGDLLVAGGGTRNATFMGLLRERLPGVRIRRTDELGVPEAAKEALVFAIIGFLTLHGLPATIPSCTGAQRPSVLGSVTPGQRPLPLPVDREQQPPTRLVVQAASAAS